MKARKVKKYVNVILFYSIFLKKIEYFISILMIMFSQVLDLQSTYKSDKRFVLDERFVDDASDKDEENTDEQEKVELEQADEKSKQLNILQDVLGIPIRTKPAESTVKAK